MNDYFYKELCNTGCVKVAVVSTYYGSDMGGAEVSSRLLVEGLRTAGHTVEVFGLTNSLTWLPLSVKAFLLNTHYLDRYVENWLFKSLNGKDFDVVHIQDLMISVGAVRACNRLSLKSVVTVRDVRFVCNLSVCQEDSQLCHGCTDSKYLECLKIESKRRYDVSALAHLLKPFIQNRSVDLCGALLTASTVVAISKFISGELLELGIESTVVYNPMPEWKLEKRIKNEDLVLFAPGRLESYKGHQYLISAIPKVLASGKRVQLRIAGTGGYEGELKKLVKTLKLESCVSFLGKLNYDEMHEEYRKSDP